MSFGKWSWEISLLVVSVWSDKQIILHNHQKFNWRSHPTGPTSGITPTLTSLSHKRVNTECSRIRFRNDSVISFPLQFLTKAHLGWMPMPWGKARRIFVYFCICFSISPLATSLAWINNNKLHPFAKSDEKVLPQRVTEISPSQSSPSPCPVTAVVRESWCKRGWQGKGWHSILKWHITILAFHNPFITPTHSPWDIVLHT